MRARVWRALVVSLVMGNGSHCNGSQGGETIGLRPSFRSRADVKHIFLQHLFRPSILFFGIGFLHLFPGNLHMVDAVPSVEDVGQHERHQDRHPTHHLKRE